MYILALFVYNFILLKERFHAVKETQNIHFGKDQVPF